MHVQLFDTVNVKTINKLQLIQLFEMSCFTRSTSLSIGSY